MPLSLPYLSGPSCTRQSGINHRAHHAQMRTWVVHKCRVAGWLAGWETEHRLEICSHIQSRNPPKIHPGINRAAMPRDWQQHRH